MKALPKLQRRRHLGQDLEAGKNTFTKQKRLLHDRRPKPGPILIQEAHEASLPSLDGKIMKFHEVHAPAPVLYFV